MKSALAPVIVLALACPKTSISQTSKDLPPGLEAADAGWVERYIAEIDSEMILIRAAYELDAASEERIRQVLLEKLVEQWQYEKAASQRFATMKGRIGDSTSDGDALTQAIVDFSENLPLGEKNIVRTLETALSPDVIAAGNPRLKQLRQRRKLQNEAKEEWRTSLGTAKGRLRRARAARSATLTVVGNPQPRRGDPRAGTFQPSSPTRAPAPRRPSSASRRTSDSTAGKVIASRSQRRRNRTAVPRRSSSGDSGNKRGPVAPAPPLDTWDKHLDKTAGQFQFSDQQRTKAQAILRDLRRRAEQYRLSRAPDFAAAERETDAKARRATEGRLNEPLDRMFDELKQRLDALATIQQRARAASPTKKR